ncbi:hypothetical protein GM51_9235 [freshwater metagenome]|uniref:DUF541 domain-containing protein n=1 Tax=freshwater metagenome TaxID=449393 RepID=A0A094Q7G7_9ZZZZ
MTLKKFVGIAAIVVLALLVLRGCGDGQGMGRDHDDHGDRGSMSAQGVTVQATGTVKAVPDGVSFNFAISVLAQSSESAMSDASATAELVRAALEAAGVDQEDIATQNVSVYPEYLSSSIGTQTLSGYRAQQVFTVTLRDTAKAGEVVDSVIAAGGNSLQVYGVTPTLLDTDAAVAQAREAAMKSAKEKANDYAGLVDADLGSVVYVTEVTSPSSPIPLMVGDSATASSPMAKTEINLGTQDVSVTVEVRWSLD